MTLEQSAIMTLSEMAEFVRVSRSYLSDYFEMEKWPADLRYFVYEEFVSINTARLILKSERRDWWVENLRSMIVILSQWFSKKEFTDKFLCCVYADVDPRDGRIISFLQSEDCTFLKYKQTKARLKSLTFDPLAALQELGIELYVLNDSILRARKVHNELVTHFTREPVDSRANVRDTNPQKSNGGFTVSRDFGG